MSRQAFTTSKKGSKIAPAPQPFCAHCANIGKPESVYRSHFVRASADPKSVIICPELLSTECNHCFKSGHTRTHCPILAAKEAQRKKEEKRQIFAENFQKKAEEASKTQPMKVNPTSKFAVLMDSDSDSQDEAKPVIKTNKTKHKTEPKSTSAVVVVDQFPALLGNAKVAPTQLPSTISYAGMAAKTKSEYEDEVFLKEKMKNNIVAMPSLIRTQARGNAVQPTPKNSFWDAWDESNEAEIEYAARQIEIEEHKKKMNFLKASDLDWAAEESDSDDEDW
jgi:hypothetical protein